MFSRKKSLTVGGNRIDRFLDSIAAQEQSWKKAKPFFPTLTKFLLIVGLGFLSWLATYTGMLELIQANAGYLDFSYKIAIAFAVAMLMLMIIYVLDALFSPMRWWLRVMYVVGYVFLTLISVGFGFGFYWKFLESRAEATRSAESAVGQVQTALQAGQTRLEQLQTTLDSLTALSARKADLERKRGRTCPDSPAGDGPRRRLRDADANNFRFASGFVSQRVDAIKKDVASLNGDMAKVVTSEKSTFDPKTGTRNAFLRGLGGRLDLTIARFNAFRTDPQLSQFRNHFAKRSEQTIFDDGRGRKFRCPDPQLQIALRGVVKAIDGLPELDRPPVTAVEGSEAIVEAFRRLTTTTFGLLTLKLPPTPDELRFLQHKAVQSVQNTPSHDTAMSAKAGLGERDYIPLFVAIFVDLCILLVSVNRPVNRLQGFINAAREARDAQMHEVLNRFHEVHKGKRSQRLDIFHDAMFDWNGDHYVAVPLDLRTLAEDDDEKKKVTQARYLSTIMAALEEARLVKRSLLVGAKTARRKLMELSSPFAASPSFRVYRFTNGAWPAIVLDDILGASDKLIAERTAEAHRQAVHDLFSPQSSPRRAPDWSDLPRPDFPCSTPLEKQMSERSARRREAGRVASANGGPADFFGDDETHTVPAAPNGAATTNGAATPNVTALGGRGGNADLSATTPEWRPEETTGPDADPAMSAAVAGSSNGAFAGNGLARQSPAGPEPDAEFLETFETERVDDNQPRLPFAPAGAAAGGSSSAARNSLADQLSKAGGKGSAEDLVALDEIAAEPGAANGSAETFILDRNIVDDLAEVMSAAAMPPEPPAFKAGESPPNRGKTQDLVPEPPKRRDRQLIIAVSEREIASAERTENTVSHARELVAGSDGASVGVKAQAKSKSKTSWATKHFGGFLKSSPDKLTKEDPVFSRHQPKIDIEKIAQHFSSGSKPRTKIS